MLIGVLTVVVGIGGRLFISKYGPVIEQHVTEALRDQLTTELTLSGEPSITLFDDLPFVSAKFEDVLLADALDGDTLLSAQTCFVRLNIWEVLQDELSISGIKVENGTLNIIQTENGEWNFRVWKMKEDSKGATNFNLEKVELHDMAVVYDDRKVDLYISSQLEISKLKGSFHGLNQSLRVDLEGHLNTLRSGRDLHLEDLPLGLAGVLDLDNENKIYSVDMGNALLAGNELVWNGKWIRQDDVTEQDITVSASNLRIESLLNRIWPDIPPALHDLNLTGEADFDLTMKGVFTKSSGPQTDIRFDLRGGSMNLNSIPLTSIRLSGSATAADLKKMSTSNYDITRFEVSTPTGNSSGSFVLTDLENPKISLNAKGTASLKELLTLAKQDPNASGSTTFDLKFDASLGHRFKFTQKEINSAKLSGSISLNDASFTIGEGIPSFRNLNGNLVLSPTLAEFKNFSGELGSLGFDANVQLKKPKTVMLDEGSSIRFEGNAHIDRLDIPQITEDWKNVGNTEGSGTRQLTGNIAVTVDQLIYNKFTAENITSDVRIRNEGVTAHDMAMSTMGGTVSGDVAYTQLKSGNHTLGVDASLKNINITRLFGEWDNFGQEFLKSEHLEGVGNADILTRIELDKDLNVIPEKLTAQSELNITNGKLKQFKPLHSLAKYIELTELEAVGFDTLTNKISMANSRIDIPSMRIKSSIMDVNFYGHHGLDNVVDYHINLMLDEVLGRKAKSKKREIEGHEIVEASGNTRLFLWMRGPLNDLKIGFDNKEIKQKLKEDFKQEGNLIKKLFAEEFGGKKSEEEDQPKKQEQAGFRLEDDGLGNEDYKDTTPELAEKPKKEKKKGGLFGWLKDDEEKRETKEGEFKIDFD